MSMQRLGAIGSLILSVVLICSTISCGGTSPAAVSSIVTTTTTIPPAVTITVSPSTTTVFTSLSQQFTPTVVGTTNTGVTWSVNGVAGGNQKFGTINDSGLYTAPTLVPTPALLTVTATSVANSSISGSAQVRVVTPITISLSPTELTLLPGESQYFTAVVGGPIPSGVTWTVSGIPGGNSTVGTLVTTRDDPPGVIFGQYTAPSFPPFTQPLIVEAVSTVDPAAFATARVFIPLDTQLPQNTPIKLGTTGGNASDLLMNGGNIGGCCSGTLGSLLSRGGKFYILSNNHVLDKSDLATIGDPIVQPGLGDVNCQVQNTATVGHLSQAPALHGAPSNVDAAMAEIVPGTVDTSGTILDLGGPNQPAAPSSTLADALTVFSSQKPVAKVGRSSGLTCGSITAIDANIPVHYETSCGSSSQFQVSFTNQIVVTGGGFTEPGDSGALVVTADTARPLGLLYAGNASSAVLNPVQDVLSALKDPSTGEVPKFVGAADHSVACPNTGQTTVTTAQAAFTTQIDAAALDRARIVEAQYETELMQDPAVSRVSVGASDDDPGRPAIVVHVKSSPQIRVPHQVGGVRTKIVFDQTPSAMALSKVAIKDAMQLKDQHSAELLSNPKVLGIGVGASKDGPGEAAIVIFLDRSSTLSMPLEIDGTRTQIIRTDPFRTSGWGKEVPSACSRLSKSGSVFQPSSGHAVPSHGARF